MQRKQLQDQRSQPNNYNPNMSDEERDKMYRDSYQQERQKQLLTQALVNVAGASANRGIPPYNMHQQQGREGLVDPSLTQQQTRLPLPFDQQYQSTANLIGILQALPPQLGQANQSILNQVDSLAPQMQRALKPAKSIYQQVPAGFVENRLNIALQRKREKSIYALV